MYCNNIILERILVKYLILILLLKENDLQSITVLKRDLYGRLSIENFVSKKNNKINSSPKKCGHHLMNYCLYL